MADIVVDDNFEDLTGNSEDKPKKRSRKERKAELAQAPLSTVSEDEEGGKKKKKKDKAVDSDVQAENETFTQKLLFRILVVAVPVLLVGGFVFEEIYWNRLGVRDWTRDMLMEAAIWLEPETATVQRILRNREKDVEVREKEIENLRTQRESEFYARIGVLDDREAELDAREEELDDREEQLEEYSLMLDEREEEIDEESSVKVPIYRRALTDQELGDMRTVSATYAAMAPDVAAEILMMIENIEDVAAIVYFMTERNAAAILSEMDPEFAASLTEVFLYE